MGVNYPVVTVYVSFFLFYQLSLPWISLEDSHNEITSENEDHEESTIHDNDAEQKADYNNIPDVPLYFEDEKVLTLRVQLGKDYLDNENILQTS